MSNTKHTHGPWMVGHFNDVRTRDGYRSLANVSSYFELPAEANARLIAAAPELLEALEAFKAIDAFEGWHPKYRDAIEKAEAAIAKATGTP